MQLELSNAEQQELIKLVKTALGDVNSEIHHAMDHETRETFRQRRELLASLLQRLGSELRFVA